MTKEEAIKRFQRMKKIMSIPNSDAERTIEAIDMAIESLSSETVHESCEDCPLYDKERHNCPRFNKVIPRTIAETAQWWVPCCERLPNESGDYLCTIPLDEVDTYVDVLSFHKSRFYEDDAEWGATYHDDVLAWMDLPKPYKGGVDE